MTQKEDTVYLRHISEAIEQINEYLCGVSHQQFSDTKLFQDGVIRQLEIIGEATKNLSELTRRSAPDVPWRSMAGMRDKLIHQYFGVDIDAVWSTATQDLPNLRQKIKTLLDRKS
ncbi:DUF86 domain-containing protein [Pelovirga terrestris]|uniref:DUF86 domain-containing protein n=1 Tax=Pelovirga terrestris TaxID=2771352 RepID=A0A8J6QLS8_9BACT|nr:DUF86 domain-containing protein [Pelovirga terrestris]MBD1399338.1 DUF86 domain-containing protein [Pelovirga terrestris]